MAKTTLLVRIEVGEKQAVMDEAKRLGLSMSDVVRLKLRKPLSLEEVPEWVPKL